MIVINFIDNHSDLDTVNYISKSMNAEILEKAIDRTKLVPKIIINKNGDRTTVYVNPNEKTSNKNSTSKIKKEPKKKDSRPVAQATPFTITDKLKHLVPFKMGVDSLPEHFKSNNITVPPKWREVLISHDPDATLWAVGKDEQNRPQYVYNPKFVAEQKDKKFNKVRDFLKNREKVLEFINKIENSDARDCLSLIFHTGIRPGSTRDTKSKVEALGATTLRGENVVVKGDEVRLVFIGKKGVKQDHIITNPELKSMLISRKNGVKDNEDLFKITDSDLRNYLRPLNMHPKDLRTMLATHTASRILKDIEPTTNVKEFNKIRNHVGDVVCKILGNQRSMSLNEYIDPKVFSDWSPEGMDAWSKKGA